MTRIITRKELLQNIKEMEAQISFDEVWLADQEIQDDLLKGLIEKNKQAVKDTKESLNNLWD